MHIFCLSIWDIMSIAFLTSIMTYVFLKNHFLRKWSSRDLLVERFSSVCLFFKCHTYIENVILQQIAVNKLFKTVNMHHRLHCPKRFRVFRYYINCGARRLFSATQVFVVAGTLRPKLSVAKFTNLLGHAVYTALMTVRKFGLI
jgi:hypothetical protein